VGGHLPETATSNLRDPAAGSRPARWVAMVRMSWRARRGGSTGVGSMTRSLHREGAPRVRRRRTRSGAKNWSNSSRHSTAWPPTPPGWIPIASATLSAS